MKKYFRYGFSIGFIIVFLYPWSFQPIYLCGEGCNSWINMTKRFYGFSDMFPFNWVIPLVFMTLMGLAFTLLRFIFIKIRGNKGAGTPVGRVETIADRILIVCLAVVIAGIVVTKFFITPTQSRIPAAPGIYQTNSAVSVE